MNETICHCFGYTSDDIREDERLHDGRSLILERIVEEKKQGACRCGELNPQKR